MFHNPDSESAQHTDPVEPVVTPSPGRHSPESVSLHGNLSLLSPHEVWTTSTTIESKYMWIDNVVINFYFQTPKSTLECYKVQQSLTLIWFIHNAFMYKS